MGSASWLRDYAFFTGGAGSAITPRSLNHRHLLLWQNMSTGIFRSLRSPRSRGEEEWKSDDTHTHTHTHNHPLRVCVIDSSRWQCDRRDPLQRCECGVSADPPGGHRSPLDTISKFSSNKVANMQTNTRRPVLWQPSVEGDLSIRGDMLRFSERWREEAEGCSVRFLLLSEYAWSQMARWHYPLAKGGLRCCGGVTTMFLMMDNANNAMSKACDIFTALLIRLRHILSSSWWQTVERASR